MSGVIRTYDVIKPTEIGVVSECPFCGKQQQFVLDREAYGRWAHGGELVQRAFPEQSVSVREALITGMCDDCWPEEPEE